MWSGLKPKTRTKEKIKITVLGAWFLILFLNVQSFGAGQQGKGSWRIRWVEYIILGRVRKQKDVKNPNPYPILALWFLEWSLVELQVESENLTQILGWVMDAVHGGCTCLYLSITSADLQRHATLSASWRWLKMHRWKINLLLPFGLRGAQCSEEILAELWPSWDA